MSATSRPGVLSCLVSRRSAQVVSEVLGPVPLGVLLCAGVGMETDRWAGARWGLLAATFAAVVPYVATWRMRHPPDGTQTSARGRVGYLLVTMLSALAGVGLTTLLGAPRRVVAVAVTIVAGLAVAAALNARWRGSNHAAAAGGGTAILAVLYGPVFLVGYVIVAMAGWSRVRLGRHTAGEVLLGALAGSVVCAALLPLLT